ncbi:hypothetical protein [Nonomuraea dietziae]|uniref:hypothetical protein n=1 Tax=Nonomuraea dietziae TaxID=65515 RepID=UPI0031D089D1
MNTPARQSGLQLVAAAQLGLVAPAGAHQPLVGAPDARLLLHVVTVLVGGDLQR